MVQKNQGKRGRNYFRHHNAANTRNPDGKRQEMTDGAIIYSIRGINYFVLEEIISTAIRWEGKHAFPGVVDPVHVN